MQHKLDTIADVIRFEQGCANLNMADLCLLWISAIDDLPLDNWRVTILRKELERRPDRLKWLRHVNSNNSVGREHA